MSRTPDFTAPVPPDNPPRPRRARRDPDAPQPASDNASGPASNVDSDVATPPAGTLAVPQAPPQAPRVVAAAPQLTVTRALTMGDLMHGAPDPEADLTQSGARLPRYVLDAVRAVVATSRGQWTMQRLVTEAVKAFMPPEVLTEAWQRHGGAGQPGNPDT